MDSIGEFFGQKDAFAKSCGIELLNVRPGSVNAGSELKKEQPGGIGLARAGQYSLQPILCSQWHRMGAMP